MQIIYLGEGNFELKTKSATILTGKEIKINDFVLPGDGEYEVADIQVEMIDNITAFHNEELNIIYLDKRKKILSDKEIERVNGADILFVGVGGGEVFDPKGAVEAINQIEPKIIIPMYYQDISEFLKVIGGPHEESELFKITKSQVNVDEQKKVMILTCKK